MLGVVHYWWLVKADIRRPQTYAAVMAVLLGVRVVYKRVSSALKQTAGGRLKPSAPGKMPPELKVEE